MIAAKAIVVTLALGAATIAAALATISGTIDAVEWGVHTFGDIPVALTGTFLAGAMIMHAIDRAIAVREHQSRRSRHEAE